MNFRIRHCNKLQHLYQLRDPQQRAPYKEKLIPNAQVYVPPVPFGKLLIQRVSLLNMIFWHFDLTVEQTSQFEFYPDTPATAFHYMLINSMELQLDGDSRILKEGETSLLYLRNINYDITLEPGNYVFIHIDPSFVVWQQLYELYPGIKKDVETASQTMGAFLKNGPCEIGKEEKELIADISTQPATRGRSALQRMSFELIKMYLEKCKPTLELTKIAQ